MDADSSTMVASSGYSIVLDRPISQVWDVVRDFNSYPIWVNGVEESHIEDGLSGSTVGAVRNFATGGFQTRQRLLAHSDCDHYFTYASCASLEIASHAGPRTLTRYQGTLRLERISEGERCLAQWSASYSCPPEDEQYWADWWSQSLPQWLGSLRAHLDR